ncbi:MAG TPA: hypothetical protein VMU46_03900 [Burkholderiales bacterium]|nr:hypothetical protein [Burkholderiales bacterium]
MKSLKLACAALLAAVSTHAAAVGGLADVTVFDRSDGRQLPVYWHEGRAYVVGKPGNEYAVRIRNRQREEVLGVISVDGVNVITGETASSQQSGYVLAPYRQFDISGWRKNLASTAAFYFTALPDSYAARTGRPDNVGVIGVAFYRKKAEPAPVAPPAPFSSGELSRKDAPAAAESSADAQNAPRSMAQREDRLGTGHGRVEASYTRYVGFERASSEPAETVAIYYDSYRNLLARGIIPQPIAPCAINCLPYRPQPNPFPGFVPDPPA